jgi:hypothetical protein
MEEGAIRPLGAQLLSLKLLVGFPAAGSSLLDASSGQPLKFQHRRGRPKRVGQVCWQSCETTAPICSQANQTTHGWSYRRAVRQGRCKRGCIDGVWPCVGGLVGGWGGCQRARGDRGWVGGGGAGAAVCGGGDWDVHAPHHPQRLQGPRVTRCPCVAPAEAVVPRARSAQ